MYVDEYKHFTSTELDEYLGLWALLASSYLMKVEKEAAAGVPLMSLLRNKLMPTITTALISVTIYQDHLCLN